LSACAGERSGGHSKSCGIADHSFTRTIGTSPIPKGIGRAARTKRFTASARSRMRRRDATARDPRSAHRHTQWQRLRISTQRERVFDR
jgi:hypothetical protein